MSELRTRLERLGERVAAPPDAFERLERVRRRREHNRRISAGVVALLIAVAGSIAAFSAFRGSDGTTVGGDQDGFFALWPEQTATGLAVAQERVDSGDAGFVWRSDPIEIARRFALEMLQWPAVDVEPAMGTDLEADASISIDLSVPAGSSCDQLVADATCPTSTTTLTMERLGRPDGVWSITAVASQDLALELPPGEEVPSGAHLVVPTALPDGTKVSMGVAFLTACDATGTDDNVEVSGGLLTFTVPDAPDGCIGYLYAITPQTGVGAVAIGSFLLTDAQDVPGIGYLVDRLAAVPVRFASNGSPEVAGEARIECGASTPLVETPLVSTRPDGVHVELENPTGETLSFSIVESGTSSSEASASTLEPGVTRLVLTIPPGPVEFSCSSPPPGPAGVDGIETFEVVDPAGRFVPTELECASGEAYGSAPAYPADATGVEGDPVLVVEDHVSGLGFDDVVERAGYPESSEPVVTIVRDGLVVGRVTLFDDGQGGWLVSSVEGCGGTQFGWSQEPNRVSGPSGETGSAWDVLCAAVRRGGADNVQSGAALEIEGRDLDFDTPCLIAPAGEPITISFSNVDAGVPRNLSIYELTPFLRECLVTGTAPSRPPEEEVFVGEIITGVDEIVYELGRMAPGEYYFQDDVHPSSNGVLVVE